VAHERARNCQTKQDLQPHQRSHSIRERGIPRTMR
jgi:hypothetical protein